MSESRSASAAASGRIVSLDVLRGLAILLMILSGMLPKTLPNWVDHGYNPHFKPDASGVWTLRPEVATGNVFDASWHAYTWVDLVFPMFLFAMGAAIPQALGRRQAAGVGKLSLIVGIFGRWLTLIVFAVLVVQLTPEHLKATFLNTRYFLTLVGFVLSFLFFVRWPKGTPAIARLAIRAAALAAIVALITAYTMRPDNDFAWTQSEVIILVLADTYLVAAVACVLTPGRPWLRLALLLPFMVAIHWLALGSGSGRAGWAWVGDHPKLSHLSSTLNALPNVNGWAGWIRELGQEHEWLQPLLDFRQLFNLVYLKHLWTVIPGTIAGDWIAIWSQRRTVADDQTRSTSHPGSRWAPLMLVTLVAIATFVGLRSYGFPLDAFGGPLRTPWLVLLLVPSPLILMGASVLPYANGQLWINRNLFRAGVAFFGIGLILSCLPIRGGGFFEGGISKGGGPMTTTLGYHFTSAGLCFLLLVGLITAFDGRRRSKGLGIVAANGQNPLMAYYLSHAVLASVLSITLFRELGHPFGSGVETLNDLLTRRYEGHDWMLALVAAVKTFAVALFVWVMTRLRIFWRA